MSDLLQFLFFVLFVCLLNKILTAYFLGLFRIHGKHLEPLTPHPYPTPATSSLTHTPAISAQVLRVFRSPSSVFDHKLHTAFPTARAALGEPVTMGR